MGKYGNGEKGSTGEISFGGIDHSKYSGELQYAPVVSKGYWEVQLTKFKIGVQEVPVLAQSAAM